MTLLEALGVYLTLGLLLGAIADHADASTSEGDPGPLWHRLLTVAVFAVSWPLVLIVARPSDR